MSNDNTLIFFDIPSKIGTWSPNTAKTRYTLNFKGIPYKVVWIEYPDIEPKLKELGIAPCTTKADGVTPLYTLPAIYDPDTKTGLTDSFAIAQYLDKKYPDKPILVPQGTRTLQAPWPEVALSKITPIWQFALPKVTWSLNPASEEYFPRTRLEHFGMSMEEFQYPSGQKRVQEWKKLEKGFGEIAKWYRKEDTFIMGEQICFADFALGGFILWLRILFGKDSQEWKDVTSWDDGRWGRLIQAFEKYE